MDVVGRDPDEAFDDLRRGRLRDARMFEGLSWNRARIDVTEKECAFAPLRAMTKQNTAPSAEGSL